MKVRDLLEQAIDVDVYDNVTESLSVAYEHEVKLTDAGKERFAEVLDYDVKLLMGNYRIVNAIVDIDRNGADGWTERLKKAEELFYGMAGYCTEDEFNSWFVTEGVD